VQRVAAILADPPQTTTKRSVEAAVIVTGLGASPGLASGAIATSAEAAVRMADEGTAVLLVRSETSPDDVHGMARAVGILTATGGLASHAAVVARGWDIPAVVGAAGVMVGDGLVTIGGTTYRQGDVLSVDGASGEVFAGAVEALRTIVPEAAILLNWAHELRIAIGRGEEHEAMTEGSRSTEGDEPVTREDVIQTLVIKGYVTADLLAPALGVGSEEAAQLLDRLAADGIATGSSGMFSLSADGKALGAEILALDRESWGPAMAGAALDGFVALDGRMKTIVTAWQMKTVDGQPVLNDHSDAEYDARVLADLAALHADACAWIRPLIEGLPRLARYRRRLDAAAAAAADGDGRYIASPRVDSYHGVWFELHEDLIRLAGKTREQEVAAGRA
jgi:pyruvate, orthophosphate dikinase